MHDFVTTYMDYLENIGSLSCVDLPNVDTFPYTMLKKKKIMVANITLGSSEKSLNIGKLSS